METRDPIARLREIAATLDDAAASMSEHGFSIPGIKAKTIADAIEAQYMRLPVDADGVPIRPGDKVFGYGRKKDGMTVRFLDQHGNLMVCDTGSTSLRDSLYWVAENVTHSAPDTVESLLADMVKEIASEHVIYVPDDKKDEFGARLRNIRDDYAERIRKAVENEQAH